MFAESDIEVSKPASRSEEARTEGSSRVGMVLLFLAGGAALIGCYAWYVLRRIDYFVERDLRGLSTLTTQIESEVARQQEAVTIFANAAPDVERLQRGNPKIAAEIFKDFVTLERAEEKKPGSPAPPLESVAHEMITTGSRPRIEIRSSVPDLRDGTVIHTATGVVMLDDVVRPYLSQPFLTIFDVVLLARADGKILQSAATTNPPPLPVFSMHPEEKGTNALANGMLVTDLAALEESDGWLRWKSLNVGALRGASRRTDVRIMENEYYLFSQPARLLSNSLPAETGAQTNAPKQNGTQSSDLLICALVPKQKFRFQALTISDSSVAVGVGTIILILCCYPFLRIAELPKQAPLRPADVVLAALAALVGSGVMAVMISDTITYRRIRSIEDGQLESYGQNLRRDLVRDVLRGAILTEAMLEWAKATHLPAGQPVNDLQKRIAWSQAIWQQPYFTGFVWADRDGRSIVTAATKGVAPPSMAVSHRAYFRDVVENRCLTIVEKNGRQHRVALEIERSRGDPETTIAIPDENGVFAVTYPLIHFIDPVVPPGFGFAVIDEHGMVQFHSEKQRALNENFFKEADDNRHLRAAVYTRQDAHVDARYWGSDHQLYVAPVPGTPWTVVAMRDESVLRSVNSEVLAMTALLLSLYAAVYAIAFVFLAAVRPQYRVPWLWPDHKRALQYRAAIIALILEALAFLACMLTLGSWEILYIGFLAPLRGLTTAFVILNLQARDREWRIGVVVWLLLTGLWLAVLISGSPADVIADRFYSPAPIKVLPLLFILLPLLIGWAAFEKTRADKHVEEEPSGKELESAFILYKLTGSALVLLIAVLPALSFLKIAMRTGIETRIKYAQLRLADMLVRRLNRLERMNSRDCRIAFDCYGIPYVFQSEWTLDPRSAFGRAGEAGKCGQSEQVNGVPAICGESDIVKKTWIPSFVQYLLPRYSESSIAMRDLHHDTASDRTWRWCRGPYVLTLKKQVLFDDETSRRLYGKVRPANIIIRSAIPVVMYQDQLFARSAAGRLKGVPSLNCVPPADSSAGKVSAVEGLPPKLASVNGLPITKVAAGIVLLAVFVLILWSPFQAVGFIGRRVFLFHVRSPNWRKDGRLQPAAGTNLFVHLSTSKPEDIIDFAFFERIDIEPAISKTTSWADLQLVATGITKPLLIPGFEVAFTTSSLSDGVLPFLEALLASRPRSIVILSKVSAATILAYVGGTLREHWEAVFAQFAHLDESAIKQDDFIPARLEDSNYFIFERIWAASSPAERLVLFQVARDGLVNEKEKEVLRRLLGRRLARWSPELHLATKGLERFVLMAGRRENLAAAERFTAPPRWQSLKVAIFVLVILGVVVMLTTQKDLINSTSAILTAIAAAVPALLHLIAVLDGRSGEGG